MNEGCYGCTQKAIELQAQQNAVVLEAARLAKETGTMYGIFRDGTGQWHYTNEPGYPVERYISPNLFDTLI